MPVSLDDSTGGVVHQRSVEVRRNQIQMRITILEVKESPLTDEETQELARLKSNLNNYPGF